VRGGRRSMIVELLYFDGCPHAEALLSRVRGLMAEAGVKEPVQLRRVASAHDAVRERFLGSPTLRINGRDVEPGADDRDDYGLKCRIYRTPDGIAGIPADHWIHDALRGLS
jgi:hypothetical protein